jgi:hypothetical protein
VVAVLSDRGGAVTRSAADVEDMPKVRVFLKPLHMHGLLGLVKRLEREEVGVRGE